MPTLNVPTERLDNLALEAVTTVFESMVQEKVSFKESSCLLTGSAGDLLPKMPLISTGFYTVSVNFIGDANGKVMLSMPTAASENFAKKLFDVPSLEWVGDDAAETMRDTMGELGNMLVGLVKGGLTKWYPSLMLQTPKVLVSKRLKIDNSRLTFRKQYVFTGFGEEFLIDFNRE